MKQSPSRKATSYSASQRVHHAFMEREGSLPCSQQPDTSPYPHPDASIPHLLTFPWYEF